VSKQLTIALALALTVNITALASAQNILGRGEDQASTEKGKDRFKTARAGAYVDQGTSPEYRSGADSAANSKEVPGQLDSPVDDTGLDMDPTIALFLVVSVLLVVVIAIVAASRRGHRQA
jgi:hypothetical protein